MKRLLFLLAVAVVPACYGSGTVGYTSGYYDDTGLAFVEAGPGVYAIANYPEPVFYSNNYYWRYSNSNWYRSPYYNHGWTYSRAPHAVATVRYPERYAHYRPTAHDRVVIRDQRGNFHYHH
jgi:hypothetical protein